jgi:hypothetical protein
VCMLGDEGRELSADVCLERGGHDKAAVVRRIYAARPAALLLFSLLLDLFRAAGLCKSALIGKG